MVKGYKTIYVDPPWPERGAGKIKRGADRHYKLMTIQEIIDMKSFIQDIAAENCHLYLWVTNNFLPDGLKVINEWGFKYITVITWLKDRIGLGQYFRGATEHCLFAKRGKLPFKILDGKRQQGITAIYHPKELHSKKPHRMREYIEKVSWPPYIEIFARYKHPGWESWGIESKWDLFNNAKN